MTAPSAAPESVDHYIAAFEPGTRLRLEQDLAHAAARRSRARAKPGTG